MSFSFQTIHTERRCKAIMDSSELKFMELSQSIKRAYINIFGYSIEAHRSNSSQESIFSSYEALLFFMLFSLNLGLAYDAHLAIFGCDGTSARINQTLDFGVCRFVTLFATIHAIQKNQKGRTVRPSKSGKQNTSIPKRQN